jgi:TRAP-type C4-dicarboxylate transport system substrate-binding protein
MTMKNLMLLAGAVALALGTAAPAVPAHAADVVLKLGDDVAPASVQAQAIEKFAEEVAKRDVGIEVQYFHGSQLGTGAQQIQNVKLGIQDMVNTGYELLDVFSEKIKIASTPFTFADYQHFENWLKSPDFEEVQQEIVEKGNQRIINLGVVWKRGPFRVMIASEPILTLDELSQVKFRVHESEVVKRFWGKEGLGATVVVLPLSDVYLSLRQGVVDAITMPFDLIVPMKFTEVAKHVMLLRDYPQFLPIMINEAKWQSLTPEQQQALTEAADEAGRFYNAEIEKNVEQWRAELEASGVIFHEVDRGPWVERIRERNRRWEEEGYWSAGLVDTIDSYRQ